MDQEAQVDNNVVETVTEDQKPPMPAMLGHSRWGLVSKSVLDTLNKNIKTMI